MITGIKYWDALHRENSERLATAVSASVAIIRGMGLLRELEHITGNFSPEEALFSFLSDPDNDTFLKIRPDLEKGSLSGTKIPQFYPVALRSLFGVRSEYLMDFTFQDLAIELVRGFGVLCFYRDSRSPFGAVAYDDDTQEIIGFDSIRRASPGDGESYRRIDKKAFMSDLDRGFIVFRSD